MTGMVRRHLAPELQALPDAVLVPLCGKVAEVLDRLARDGLVDPDRVLSGLQHPSGSNAERIAYQLGRKPRERLSAKVNAAGIDAASAALPSVARNEAGLSPGDTLPGLRPASGAPPPAGPGTWASHPRGGA